MRLAYRAAGVAAAVLTLACAVPADDRDAASEPAEAPSRAQAPTIADLANATYSGIEEAGPVTLENGNWQGEPFVEGGASVPELRLTEKFYVTGDLDGDGTDEAVAHLVYRGGGSGSFGYLAVMSHDDGEIVQKATGFIGDRVQVRGARIDGADVMLDVLQSGPGDGLCCPSQLATRRFALRDSELVETGTEVTGTASLETLEGTEWVLRELSKGEDTPEDPEVTLTFDAGQISGSSGCNSYSGSVEPGEDANTLTVGPLAGTRQACAPAFTSVALPRQGARRSSRRRTRAGSRGRSRSPRKARTPKLAHATHASVRVGGGRTVRAYAESVQRINVSSRGPTPNQAR